MVSGTKFPEGDPFLTKQNEPSHAFSSRNSRHRLAASNDYRIVPVSIAEGLADPEAWITLYKSVDGGTSWRSVLLGGCPLTGKQPGGYQCDDPTGQTAPLRALTPNFSADPTVRAGPYGTFFLSFIAGTRDTASQGVVAIQRFVDKNNAMQRDFDVRPVDGTCAPGTACANVYDPPGCNTNGTTPCTLSALKPAEDPILPDKLSIIDVGVPGQFKDKPWNAADVPGRPWNTGTCTLLPWTQSNSTVSNVSETVPAFSVYVSYANFTGQSTNDHPSVFVATSSDCGTTFGKPVKVSNSLQASQGTSLAIDPVDGTVYVAWRVFGDPTASPPKPDAIYMSRSIDGGKTWLNQPVLVSTFNAYDQSATGSSFRTLGFPTIAVSVKQETVKGKLAPVSRVHIAWAARSKAVNLTPPYGCSTSATPAACDARIVIATSGDKGNTWSAPAAVSNIPADGSISSNPQGRGHQVQPALTFAAGKLMVTWLDQRYDHSEEAYVCNPQLHPLGCNSVNDLSLTRIPKGNLENPSSCPASTASLLQQYNFACYNPDAVWTTYITDGTPGLIRRHTLDVFAATASDPANLSFDSTRVSQYAFGADANGLSQRELSPPNLPMFAKGTAAFIGDYIDAAGEALVATPYIDPKTGTSDPTKVAYKYNVGGQYPDSGTNGFFFLTGGLSPAFSVTFTDNRMVIPPLNGDWRAPPCLLTSDGGCTTPGYAGNRNQNVYSAIVTDNSLAYANINSKLLVSGTNGALRGFIITVENLTNQLNKYALTIEPPSGGTATFDTGAAMPVVNVCVQPRSSATRTVWLSSTTSTGMRVVVDVTGGPVSPSPDPCTLQSTVASGTGYASQIVLNPDPTNVLVGNGDGSLTDIVNNDMGNVVVSSPLDITNALTTSSLNNVLSSAVLSTNALTSSALSTVALSTNAISSSVLLQPNADVTNALSTVVLSSAVLSTSPIYSVVLSTNALSTNVLANVLSTNTLLNSPVTNLDPANVALSTAVLSSNVLSTVALSTNALSTAVLSTNALSSAVLSSAVLSTNALSTNALSTNALSTNTLPDGAGANPPLTQSDVNPVVPANFEIANNDFTKSDLGNGDFSDVSFTVRNRGNTDSTLAIKLLMRDAVCTPDPITQIPICTVPGYKLQLVLRKIVLTPTAIPTNGVNDPAFTYGAAYRIGLTQANALVSNVGRPIIISPSSPPLNLGQFIANDPGAATLPLAPGERAYVTLRVLRDSSCTINCLSIAPKDLLAWGVKMVAVDANASTRTHIPLIIETLSVPTMTALTQTNFTIRAFGGFRMDANSISGTLTWMNADGSALSTSPIPGLPNTGVIFNLPPVCPIFNVSCSADPGNNTSLYSTSVTPTVSGQYKLLIQVTDASKPQQVDQQLVDVIVNPATQDPAQISPKAGGLPPSFDYGQSVPLKATSQSTLPVTFTVTSGPCSIVAPVDPTSATGYYVLSATGAGTCVIGVILNGNATYQTVTVTNWSSVTINKTTTTTALAVSPSNPVFASSVTLTATVTPVNATPPIGTVTFSDGATTLGTGTLTSASGGVTSITLPNGLSPGVHTLKATYAGDSNYVASSGTASSTVTQATSTTSLVASKTTATVGELIAFTATVSHPGASGTVNFSDTYNGSTSSLGSAGIDSSTGIAQMSSSILPLGNHSVTATFVPDTNSGYSGSASSALAITINPIGTVTTLSATPNPAFFGQLVTLNASVNTTSGGAVASGTVTFTEQNTTLGTANVSNGASSITKSDFATGAHSVTASYAASGSYGASTSSALTITVNPTFRLTGSMVQGRLNHTATLLGDGRVLVAGGLAMINGLLTATNTAEIYDPAGNGGAGAFTPAGVNGKMVQGRSEHTATLLPDGTVLLAGGLDGSGSSTATSEIYDPAKNTFTAVGNLPSKSNGHTATLVSKGGKSYVLVAGGGNSSAELYDVLAKTWNPTGGISGQRTYHTASLLGASTALPAGGVLLAGGVDNSGKTLQTTTIYNISTATFSTGPTMLAARDHHTATALPNGKVVIAGGRAKSGNSFTTTLSPLVEVYDPTNAAAPFSGLPFASGTGRYSHTAVMQTTNGSLDNRVLVAGGIAGTTCGQQFATSEMYSAGAFATWAPLAAGRYAHTATLMQDGRTLLVGGSGALPPPATGCGPLTSAEVTTGP